MDKAKGHYSFIFPQAFMAIHRYENEEIFGDTWSLIAWRYLTFQKYPLWSLAPVCILRCICIPSCEILFYIICNYGCYTTKFVGGLSVLVRCHPIIFSWALAWRSHRWVTFSNTLQSSSTGIRWASIILQKRHTVFTSARRNTCYKSTGQYSKFSLQRVNVS